MSHRYHASEQWLERAERTIPLGSQTFSKSQVSYPHGVSPMFLERGQGARVWDVDGNEYLDFVNGLLCVSLGYCDPDVDAAVMAQMQNGVSFSLPHRLEAEVAEMLVELVPCAEMVRFGKNGSDVTSAAIRLARAYTGRDHVAVCGYHGWQDWYIGSTARDRGVPAAVKALTHSFTYNDLASLETLIDQHPGQLAAVIMEPMNIAPPKPGFLEGVRDLCDQHGIVLVFDEMITGFRFALGGAQQLFNITPDLATFGKGMANGYPISAVVGKREIMMLMNDIFFSGTFGGETLSLAAAKASLTKLKACDVTAHLGKLGQQLLQGLDTLFEQLNRPDWLSTAGNPSWSFLVIGDAAPYSAFELKSLFMQEIFKRGILTLGTHNLSYAHSAADIDRLLAVYSEVLPLLVKVVKERSFDSAFNGEVLKPLFKVR